MEIQIVFIIVNGITYVLMILFNILSVVGCCGLFGYKTVKEVSDMKKTKFTPIGLAFAIWIVIFALECWFLVYLSIWMRDVLEKLHFSPAILHILVLLWTIVWGYRLFTLSAILHYGILANLIYIYWILDVVYFPVGISLSLEMLYTQFSIYAPISLFIGWISAALIANLFTIPNFLKKKDESRIAAMAIVGLLIPCGILLYFKGDFIYTLTILWAIVGIMLNNLDDGRIIYFSVTTLFLGLVGIAVRLIVWAIHFQTI